MTVSWRSIVHNNHNVLRTIYYHIYLDDTYTFKYKTVCFSKLFFCSEKTFSKNLHNYNAHMKKSWKHYPFYVYTNKFLKKLVSTIRFFSRADLWSGFSAYRTSQDMIGFLFFMKNYKCITCNILHNHWPGCTFLQIFYVTTDRCKSYLDQQIEHEIWFSRQLVWQLTEISYTYPQWLGILSNALWHYLAQCK